MVVYLLCFRSNNNSNNYSWWIEVIRNKLIACDVRKGLIKVGLKAIVLVERGQQKPQALTRSQEGTEYVESTRRGRLGHPLVFTLQLQKREAWRPTHVSAPAIRRKAQRRTCVYTLAT